MDIDLSYAPKGTTHYKKEGEYAGSFYRYEDGVVKSFWGRKNRWEETGLVNIETVGGPTITSCPHSHERTNHD